MHKILKIELKSDLCTADGDGFGSVIDTDICVTDMGIPYIPARRIKGCMKEAAEYIAADKEIIKKIFGITGNDKSGSLRISDALIENADALEYEISKIKEKKPFYAEETTRLFTQIKAATAVEESGKAMENSLRFMRVVNRYAPWDKEKNLVFCAEAEIDEEYEKQLERICKALRHIGYKRNRGFGVVKCTIENASDNKEKFKIPVCEKGKKYILSYAVKNKSDLMLTGKGANETQSFISGSSVMGLLGSEYLKTGEVNQEFRNIFMNEDVKFSNLYITDENLNEYIPVTGNFAKDKTDETKTIHNTATEPKSDKLILKPLKDGYITYTDGKLVNIKPLTKTVYHNAVNTDAGLYTQVCIESGQYFRGSITGDGEYINILANLLVNADIRFGRSKTAQYSSCSLEAVSVNEVKPEKIKADKIMFALESDVILEEAGFKCLLDALGIEKSDVDENSSALKYCTVTGFNTVNRLKKPHVRALAKGSVIICKTSKEYQNVIYIGERQNEGFGKVRVFDAYKFLADSIRLTKNNSSCSIDTSKIDKMLEKNNEWEDMRIRALNYAESKIKEIKKLNASAIGRLTLMLNESNDYYDFIKRIESIKTESTQKNALNIIKNSESEHELKNLGWAGQKEYLNIILTIAKYYKKQEVKG
ncbi:MAG: RAMP superfamily CRISPR-associated protein [Oscillospiraceae bacterium]